MKNKEFLEFLTSSEAPPLALKKSTQSDILLSFRGSSIFMKFIGLQILGALISLAFCPQFGLSFFVKGHGITHELRMIGDWVCALFCGSLILTMGSLMALLFMKADELNWIWSGQKAPLIFLPAVFWGILMLLNVSLDLPKEQISYHLTWIVAAITFQFLWLRLRVGHSQFAEGVS